MPPARSRKQFRRHRVFPASVNCNGNTPEFVMAGLEPHHREEIDRKTSRSICEAVGERLQQSLKPNFMGPSARLDRLIEELRQREG
jgi:hypothetical protein